MLLVNMICAYQTNRLAALNIGLLKLFIICVKLEIKTFEKRVKLYPLCKVSNSIQISQLSPSAFCQYYQKHFHRKQHSSFVLIWLIASLQLCYYCVKYDSNTLEARSEQIASTFILLCFAFDMLDYRPLFYQFIVLVFS